MNYRVHIRRLAELDIVEALDWYEAQQPGLATEFLDEYERIVGFLENSPMIYPEIYRGVHRAVMRRFPHLIWYRIEEDVVTVLACTHGKIDPDDVFDRIS